MTTADGFQLFSKRPKAPLQRESSLETTEPSTSTAESADDYKAPNSEDISTPSPGFENIGLSSFLVNALSAVSIKTPTDVQRACIPSILAGRNVIASAKTGSGKTAAFALPILQKLAEDPYGVFALVLTPTRELAFQIAEQFKILGEGIRLKQSVIVGGMDMMKQALELSNRPHIIVGTPGRLADHLKSCPDAIFLKRLRFLVLDEADRLLDDTFAEHLDMILNACPAGRQTLLFSATMTNSIEAIRTPQTFVYSAKDRHDIVAKLDQRFIMTPSLVRDAHLVWLLRNVCVDKTVILFTGKCKTCELLRIMLRELGLRSAALHSQMSQTERIGSLAKFRTGVVPILICTDVASRYVLVQRLMCSGLDIPSVKIVINYDVPSNATDYVHRVGRTARASRGGKAITLVTEIDINLILNIESRTNKKFEPEAVPEKEVNELLTETAEAKREASLHLIDMNFGEKARNNKMKRMHDSTK